MTEIDDIVKLPPEELLNRLGSHSNVDDRLYQLLKEGCDHRRNSSQSLSKYEFELNWRNYLGRW